MKVVITRTSVLVSVLFAALSTSTTQSGTTPRLEIHLRSLGWRPAQGLAYKGTGIPENLGLLNDDTKPRLTFVSDESLAVYQSRYHSSGADTLLGSRDMEAFFVDTTSGQLSDHLTWPTRARRWVNDFWDTEARILSIGSGFLVHAGNLLISYSKDMKEEGYKQLEDGPLWSVAVPPQGHSFHVQRIQGSDASGRWLAGGTFRELQTINHETPGVTSVSDNAVVTQLVHCLQVQFASAPPQNLCCEGSCRGGIPEFFSEDSIISVYDDGFSLFSLSGKTLWSLRSDCKKRNCLDISLKPSIRRNRFAISLTGYRHAVFDQVDVPREQSEILVYDTSRRVQLLHVAVGKTTVFDFALSADGSTLAILVGDTVRLYRVRP